MPLLITQLLVELSWVCEGCRTCASVCEADGRTLWTSCSQLGCNLLASEGLSNFLEWTSVFTFWLSSCRKKLNYMSRVYQIDTTNCVNSYGDFLHSAIYQLRVHHLGTFSWMYFSSGLGWGLNTYTKNEKNTTNLVELMFPFTFPCDWINVIKNLSWLCCMRYPFCGIHVTQFLT